MHLWKYSASRLVFAGATLLLASILITACSPDRRAERRQLGEVVLNAGSDPKTLDPNLVEDTSSARVVSAFVRGMFFLDSDGKAQPDMCERWETSEDGKTWDFYIRESKWSNGMSVTAEDFHYAWIHRMLNPEFPTTYSIILFYIQGAEAYYNRENVDPREGPDPKTVGVEVIAPNHLRVRLTAPAPFFPQALAHHAYYPVCKSVTIDNPQWPLRADTYVANGPFKMVSYDPGHQIVGVKNEGYWDAANVAMNKLTFRFIEEESTELVAFENGELDGTYTAPRADLEFLREKGVLKISPEIAVYYLNINMDREIFQDLRIRRALNLAIDRASITKNVSRAGEDPAMSLVPPQLYDEPVTPYFKDGDFEEAKRLLAEAGYPDGKGFPKLQYIYNTNENHKAIAQVVQENWKRHLGIDITLENQEFKVTIENRHQGKFDIARNGWVADFADPLNFIDLFLSYSGNNDSHWKNAEYDALVEKARDESDPHTRLTVLRQAEDVLMRELPIIPIYFYKQPYLCTPDLDGYTQSPMRTVDVSKIRWRQDS
jgi:oligopeptide transport system substrate-binding protein